MKRIVYFILLIFFSFGLLSAETFYLYIEESCNEIQGIYLAEAREGIFSEIFDFGHIIFDNVADDGCGTILKKRDFSKPLNIALTGGANYLIAVRIDTFTTIYSGNLNQIESTATIFLIHVETGELIYSDKLMIDNKGKENEQTKDIFGFELGGIIAREIEQAYNNIYQSRTLN